jgi:hypothetical protein
MPKPEHAVDNERPDRLREMDAELADGDLKSGHTSPSTASMAVFSSASVGMSATDTYGALQTPSMSLKSTVLLAMLIASTSTSGLSMLKDIIILSSYGSQMNPRIIVSTVMVASAAGV